MSTDTYFALVPTVLLLGSGSAAHGEPAVAALAEQALLVAVDTVAPQQPLPHLEEHLTVPDELPAVLAAGRELARRHRVSGVVALRASFAEAAAVLAEELGLQGRDPAAVRAGRDRWETRLRLNQAGVGPVPARLAGCADEAAQAVAELGLPVLLRARDAAAGTAAQRVDRPEQLAAAFGRAGLGGQVVVEPLLAGELLTLCGTLARGEAHTWPAVRPGSAEPLDQEGELFTELAEFARRAYAALGLGHGLAGLTVLLTADGPRVLLDDPLDGAELLGDSPLAAALAGPAVDLAIGLPPRPVLDPAPAEARLVPACC